MNIEELFEVVERPGLGRVLRCKLCMAKFGKEFIVIGKPDAERHLISHELYGDNLYEEKPEKPVIQKKIRLRNPQEQTLETYISTE